MVNVLGIHGSPRKGGNSEVLLDEALKGAREAGAEIKKIRASELRIYGCTECGDCYGTGECSIADDMEKVYAAIDWSDRIIFASPIFFMGLPSQAKAIVDRAQRYWAMKYLLKEKIPRSENAPERRGIFIGVGGTKGEKLFDGVVLTLKYFFDAISVSPEEELYVLVKEVDEKAEIFDRADAISSAYESGHRLAGLP